MIYKRKDKKKEKEVIKILKKLLKSNPKIKRKVKNIKNIYKKLYYTIVWVVSENQPLHTLSNFKRRGWKKYHLDHIYPISKGYQNEIPPEKIGNIKNLRFIYYKKNIKKGSNITNESRLALRRIKKLK